VKSNYFAERLNVLKNNRINTYTDHGNIVNITNESEIVRRALVKPEKAIQSEVVKGKIVYLMDDVIKDNNKSVKMFTKTFFDNVVFKKRESIKPITSKKSILLSQKFKWHCLAESNNQLPKINTSV
jgi:hypothetical protein